MLGVNRRHCLKTKTGGSQHAASLDGTQPSGLAASVGVSSSKTRRKYRKQNHPFLPSVFRNEKIFTENSWPISAVFLILSALPFSLSASKVVRTKNPKILGVFYADKADRQQYGQICPHQVVRLKNPKILGVLMRTRRTNSIFTDQLPGLIFRSTRHFGSRCFLCRDRLRPALLCRAVLCRFSSV